MGSWTNCVFTPMAFLSLVFQEPGRAGLCFPCARVGRCARHLTASPAPSVCGRAHSGDVLCTVRLFRKPESYVTRNKYVVTYSVSFLLITTHLSPLVTGWILRSSAVSKTQSLRTSGLSDLKHKSNGLKLMTICYCFVPFPRTVYLLCTEQTTTNQKRKTS